jgi:glutathione S-transferase
MSAERQHHGYAFHVRARLRAARPEPVRHEGGGALEDLGPAVSDRYAGFRTAPKGKLPYIRDGEQVVSDSSLIRFHLEESYGIDFDLA